MMNGDGILAALLSLRDATGASFSRLEAHFTRLEAEMTRRFTHLNSRMGAMETRLDRFAVKALQRFDDVEARLVAVEHR